MLWLPLAILSYLLQAINGAIDRIIVHKDITTPAVVSFWVAVFSTSTLGLLLLGFLPGMEAFRFEVPSLSVFGLVLLAGVINHVGLLAMYHALGKGEATRVLSVLGAIVPVLTLLFSFVFLHERLGSLAWAAFAILIVGSLVLTMRTTRVRRSGSLEWLTATLLAAFFLALQGVLAKIIFDQYHFISAFALMSVGGLLHAAGLYVFAPSVRAQLHGGGESQQSRRQLFWIIGNSMLGGVAIIMLNLALKLGPPTFISALRGVQYAGVFGLALVLAEHHHAKLLDESLTRRSIILKLTGILLVANGVVLLALAS